LIEDQLPLWAGLPIQPVEPGGYDNRTFHLGDEMVVRLPSAERYVAQVDKEHCWLPYLAPHLPFRIPEPLAKGEPAANYPWPWSVYRWIPGERATLDGIPDLPGFARDTARFLTALHQIDATEGPPAGQHNFYRGGDLRVYDADTRAALTALKGVIDTERALHLWESAVATAWEAPPVWVHGDFAPGNLLIQNGGLHAVIDFGTCGVGDPACDLVLTWTFLSGESRESFRKALPLDSGTWARARAWALWKAAILVAGHADTNAPESAHSLRILQDVLAESAFE
jgi:aminoglycoside phosphotransferase (APT) family kinase protein